MDEQPSYVYGSIFGVIVAAPYMHNNSILLCLHTARQLPVYGNSSYRAKKSQRERERERERER
jgi:hypothetical protein